MTAPRDVVRTLIVDDEPLARRRLRALLETDASIEIVGEAANGNAAVRAITEKRPDLVLLDIQMPGKDGFAVLKEIAGIHQPMIVFITAHDEHAIRAFEVEAVDYVLKPVLEDRLRAAVKRAIARRGSTQDDLRATMAHLLESVRPARDDARIALKADGRVFFLPAAEIDWVAADGDDVRIHVGRATHVIRSTMSEMVLKLSSRDFVRVHRSVIVNTKRIREIQPWFKGDYVIVLADGTKVRTGRTYRADVQALMAGI